MIDDRGRWLLTWGELGLSPSDEEWTALEARMTEKHRAYHNLQHLRECLGWLHRVRSHVQAPAEVELAIWYHDAVYESMRGDNEEKSADLAVQALQAAGAAAEVLGRIRRHILATKQHLPGAEGDTAWMIDIDLAILGADEARFAEYEQQVRREYRWVPGFVFRRKRKEFLRSLLARPAIYQTAFFHERLEARARGNLARAVD